MNGTKAYLTNWRVSGFRGLDYPPDSVIYATDAEARPLLASGTIRPLIERPSLANGSSLPAARAGFEEAVEVEAAATVGGHMEVEARVVGVAEDAGGQPPQRLPSHFPLLLALRRAGVTTYADLANTPDEKLLGIKGIGPAMLSKIRAAQYGE